MVRAICLNTNLNLLIDMFGTNTINDLGDFVRNYTETTHIPSDDETFTRQSSECFTREFSERGDKQEENKAEEQQEEKQEGQLKQQQQQQKEEKSGQRRGFEISDESFILKNNLGPEGTAQHDSKANVAHGGAASLSSAVSNLSIFHKTKLCMFHREGGCKRGAACQFAHGITELQLLPNLCQTKVCPSIEAGGSCEEPECSFAHDANQLRALSGSEINATPKGSLKPSREEFYKTKMCKFHLQGLVCAEQIAGMLMMHHQSVPYQTCDVLDCAQPCFKLGSARTSHAASHT